MNKLGKRKKPSPSTVQPAAEASTVNEMADKRPMELEAGWSLMRVLSELLLLKAQQQQYEILTNTLHFRGALTSSRSF